MRREGTRLSRHGQPCNLVVALRRRRACVFSRQGNHGHRLPDLLRRKLPRTPRSGAWAHEGTGLG